MDRRQWRAAVWLGALGLMLALPAWAAAQEEAGHEEKRNIFDPSQLGLGIWTVVVFVVLLLVLKKYAWGPMLDALRRREESIRGAVEEAKVARAEMERLRADFEARMAEANAQIPKMMAEARRHAEELSAEMRAKAQADIQADRQRLRREIDTAKDQAMQELSSHVARLATLISGKALGRSVSEEDHRRLTDEALTELRQAGAGRGRNGGGV
jgi:F-type H+-transporting ATPase subunit b